MTRLQVQAHTHRPMKFRRQLLWLVRPRQGVQVDEHVVARTQIALQLIVCNLQKPRPDAVQLLSELSRPRVAGAAVHLDGQVALG
eukprot:5115129-Prymnesium_polylepis.1